MKLTITWWDLNDSEQTIQTLRDYLKEEGVKPWLNLKGIYLKTWFYEEDKNLWGAIMLWEADKYLNQNLPPNKALELIGYPPSFKCCFDVEVNIETFHSKEIYDSLEGVFSTKNNDFMIKNE